MPLTLLSGSGYLSVSNCFFWVIYLHITLINKNQTLISLGFVLTITQNFAHTCDY